MTFNWLNFRNYRLRTKLIVTYVLLTVIPMSLLGYIAYSQYTKSIEEQVGEYIPKLLEQANENIANQVSEISHLPDLLYNSSQVVGVLRKDAHQNRSSLLQDEFTINSYLSRTYINGGNPDILGVFVVSKNRVYESVKVPYRNFDLSNYSIPYGQNIELQGTEGMYILPKQTTLQFDGNPPFILLMKQLTDLENRTNLGTILIAVEVTFLKDVITKLTDKGEANLWLMDQHGHIIYHTDKNLIGTIDDDFINYPIQKGSFRTTTEKSNKLISIHSIEETGWTLVHSIEAKNLTERTDLVRNATIIAFLGFVVVSTVISILLAWNVSSPLNRLIKLMKRVEQGNFNVDLSIETKDEVGMLANSFNSMVMEIKDLIRDKYQIELKQKEAELYALQSQINPHFMYNTLETIAMAVEDDEKETVVQMVTLLGRMLRFSISNRETLVSISEELMQTVDYLTIQKIRFEDKIDFVVHEEIDARKYYTPKFILQPIVENAVKYGYVYGRITTIEITISIIENPDTRVEEVVFLIKDNGPGIKEEVLDNIQVLLESDPMGKRDSSFGLINVHARITMSFGNGFGLRVSSFPGQGTEVEIRIPALDAGNEGENNELEKN
ncbi:cache domain-containing sensor histidine kinase [Ureibacillus sinduriensis]|uniref:cache domain-containing sensor histidine kinase n=1 Tax=Ureibacillus sinduriensis TaxID=561440 RepID=UPI0005626172|nr:sensor histidine kinase [Ureibacillus sinduriensis]